MSVSLYTGHVGSGKTYEVVRNVVLPGLLSGRDVVCNIDGLSVELISAWCQANAKGAVGRLIPVDRAAVGRADFFPSRVSDGTYVASEWVPLGALVVVDEAPVYWGTDKAILPAHLAFFREHRHITGPGGVACDLVVISQTVDALHRSLKGLVEFSADCRQLKALGLSKQYNVVTYEGCRRSGKFIMGRRTHTYDKAIFPLYKSFAHGNGTVVGTDKRFTIWASRWFWLLVAACPFIAVAAIYRLYLGFFVYPEAHSRLLHQQALARAGIVQSARPGAPGGGAADAPVPGVVPGQPGGPPSLASRAPPGGKVPKGASGVQQDIASPWAIVGAAAFGGVRYVMLSRQGYPLVYLPLFDCTLSFGQPVVCRSGHEVYRPAGAPKPAERSGSSSSSVRPGGSS